MGDEHFLRYGHQMSGSCEAPTVIVKGQTLASEKIKPYEPKETEKDLLYEPETLDDYIGQEHAKEQIKTAIKNYPASPTNSHYDQWLGWLWKNNLS